MPAFLVAALPVVVTTSAPARAAVAEPQFAPFRAYPLPTARSVAIADFTGDGRDDVAVSPTFNGNTEVFKLYLYAQTTTGELEQRWRLDLSPQVNTYKETSVAAGDFDGDGKADAAVASEIGIDIFLQDDSGLGDRALVALAGTRQAEVADVDGDGLADLVANGAGAVSWLRGAGNGTFAAPTPIAAAGLEEIEVGDVTGDGRVDVVGFPLTGSRVHVFRQLADGTFTTSNYDAIGSGGLAVGDLTGDGLLDVAKTIDGNSPGAGVSLLTQKTNHALGPASFYATYDIPGTLEAGDLNGDGRLDLVTLHKGWSRVGVLLQDTDGKLTSERLFPAPYADYAKKALAIGDVSGDGRPDVVWAEPGQIVVLRALDPIPPASTTTTIPPSTTSTTGPADTTSSTITTTTEPPPPPARDQSTSYQADAGHGGSVSGGTERPPLEQRWTRDLGGTVSFPLVADGKVFALTSSVAWGSTLFALDAATGADVWGPLDLGTNAWFTYGDGQVFVVNADGVLRSLDAATGLQRWIVHAKRNELNRINSPPVYKNGVVWYHVGVASGGALYGVSSADGHRVAEASRVAGEHSVPAVSDEFVYSSHKCSPAIAGRVEDPRQGWSDGQVCSGGVANHTPVLADGILWARGSAFGAPTAFDARTGATVVTFGAGVEDAPAFDGGRGYFPSHGALEARDPLTQVVLWSFSGDAQLTLAPLVVNGYVYVASATGQVWALDGPTGEVAWTGDAGAPILPTGEVDSQPQLVGLAAGQGVVLVPASNLLVAFGSRGATAVAGAAPPPTPQAHTAAAIRLPGAPPSDETTSLRIDPSHQSRLSSGNESTPLRTRWTRDLGWKVQYSLVAEGKVFAVAGPNLFALDAATGADAWPPIALSEPSGYQKPQVTYGDGRLFAARRGGPLLAFDAGTGAQLWSTDFKGPDVLEAPPVYAEGLVYTVSHVTGLRAVSAATGREVWSECQGAGTEQPPSIVAGTIYSAGRNEASAFDAWTGASLWEYCIGSTAVGSAVAHGRVWAEGTGQTTPLTFDATTGDLVGAFGGGLPAFDDQRYYVRHGTGLRAKDATTHFTKWTFLGDGQLATNPVVIDGLVYVGSVSGRVWALDPSTGTPVWEGDAGAPLVARVWYLPVDLGTNIAAGQGLVVVPATNTLVAFEPVSRPAPPAVSRPLAWGWNPFGQVGDGSGVDRLSPVTMAGPTDVVEVAAGGYHSLVVRSDGTVWASGWNALGLLGDGSGVSRTTPVQVPGLSDVVSVATGLFHSLALKSDGSVWAWGWNGVGQVGDGTVTQRHAPVKVAGLSDIIGVSAGMYHSLAVRRDGTVWSWGWNGYGQLGDGGTIDQHTPVRARGLVDAVSVAAGGFHSLAVKRDGTAVGWGWNAFGQLGDNSNVDRRTPTPIPGLAHVTGVASGFYHSAAVHDDGTVSGWGWNGVGQVGDGTTAWRWAPVKLAGLHGVTAVSAGYYNSVARTEDGRVLGWGWNGVGQLGDGTTSTRLTPQPVPSLFDVGKVSAGSLHTLAT